MRYLFAKEVLSRLGPAVPTQAIHYANGVLNYLHVARWFHDRRLAIPARLRGRQELFELVGKELVEPVSYLEFGVLQGASLRYWARLLRHPDSFLHGFDSFEGLPENWRIMDRRLFDVGGKAPVLDDARVRLFKGWFSETLPAYAANLKPHKTLVLHMDADLYSSSAFVLQQLRPFIRPGATIIFDEFFDREHELKAFSEFLDEGKWNVRCLGTAQALTQAAFYVAAAD